MTSETTLAFIGGGNMARSLIAGLVADGWPPARIRVADPEPGQLALIAERCGPVHTTADNFEAIRGAAVVVLAVKPQALKALAQSLADAMQRERPLSVSIAAGIRAGDLEGWLGGDLAIVRCMPNTPALVQSAATGLYANPKVGDLQRDLAETVLRAVGLTVWIEDEALLDVVTALSGGGPAYFLLVMEVMERAGVELGLPRSTARLLTLQTAFGTAKLALESEDDAATLRARVTSEGGTTQKAIAKLEAGNLGAHFQAALSAATARARELADQLARE